MSYYCWGTDNGNTKLHGLIVSSYHEKYNKVANVVYVAGEKVLYPVPRHLYTPSRDQMAQMTKSFRDKMTTVLPPESIVCIQLDGPEETVACMWKGNKLQFELTNEGGDWVMEVDVAVSDEQPDRRACILGLYLNPTLVETTGAIDLNSFDPEKAYKGMIKLVIYQEMVERLLNKGIRNFIDAQKQFSQAGQACFDFLLYSIYETKQPEMRVVYEAPWQTVKRTVMLTPANFGEGPSVEEPPPVDDWFNKRMEKYQASSSSAAPPVDQPQKVCPPAGRPLLPPTAPENMTIEQFREHFAKLDSKRFEPHLMPEELAQIVDLKMKWMEEEQQQMEEQSSSSTKKKGGQDEVNLVNKKGNRKANVPPANTLNGTSAPVVEKPGGVDKTKINPDNSTMKVELRKAGEQRQKEREEQKKGEEGKNWATAAKEGITAQMQRMLKENQERKQLREEQEAAERQRHMS